MSCGIKLGILIFNKIWEDRCSFPHEKSLRIGILILCIVCIEKESFFFVVSHQNLIKLLLAALSANSQNISILQWFFFARQSQENVYFQDFFICEKTSTNPPLILLHIRIPRFFQHILYLLQKFVNTSKCTPWIDVPVSSVLNNGSVWE